MERDETGASGPDGGARHAPPSARCGACGEALPVTARFCSACGQRLDAAAPPRPTAPGARALRPMTVLFCDLVGSSGLAQGMDPEDLTESIAQFYRATTAVVARHGGHVGRLVGDGVLVYFGYPTAQEDDAERAVRAALGILEAVAALPPVAGQPLAVRVGISTGLVVVAALADTGDARHLDIFGETPNLAARLQSVAEPGCVLVSDSVQRLAGAAFLFADAGRRVIRGWSEPVQLWQPLRPRAREDRVPSAATPLFGRGAPLARLHAAWQAARAGHGGFVLVSAEAGFGKSRLLAQLLREVPTTRVIRYFAAPHLQGSALRPILRQLGRATQAPDDAMRHEKLRAILPDAPALDIGLVAEALGLAGGIALPELSPQRRRERLLRVMVDGIAALARRGPLLVAFEDAHWADPTTRDAMAAVLARITELPLLVVVTARPEFAPDWTGRPGFERIALEPLEEPAAIALIRSVARDVPLPPDVLQDIVSRADGVPLFIEELTRAVAEDLAVIDTPGRRDRRAPVPISLHASLLARLDRLGEAREVAEIAAVIGREFDTALLAPLLEAPAPASPGALPGAFPGALDKLVESGLVQRRATPGGFRFRHALIQDAALGLLPRPRYRALNGRLAGLLEARLAAGELVPPARIAHHLGEAEAIEPAVAWWRRGALEATARFAMEEALIQLRRGIALLAQHPSADAAAALEVELQLLVGNALLGLSGHSARATGEAYDRARALAERLPGQPQLRQAMHGQWSHAWMRGEIAVSLDRAEALLAEARQRVSDGAGAAASDGAEAAASGDAPRASRNPGAARGDALTVACSALGHSHFLAGRFAAAEAMLRESRRHFDPTERERRHLVAAQATLISTQCYLGWTELMTGRLAAARATLAETLALADRARVPFARANAGYALARLEYETGAAEACVGRLEALIGFCVEHDLTWLEMAAKPMLGALLGRRGEVAAGLALAREAIAFNQRIEAFAFQPNVLAIEAELMARGGDAAGGQAVMAKAFALMAANGTLWEAAPMHCQRAAVLRRLGEPEAAEGALREAVAVATAQGAWLFGLRAARALAAMLARAGRAAEARVVLDAALAPLARETAPVIEAARAQLLPA